MPVRVVQGFRDNQSWLHSARGVVACCGSSSYVFRTATIDSGDARRPKLCGPSTSEPALPVILRGAKNLSRDGRATSSQALVHTGTTARKILRCFEPQNDRK